MDLINICKEYWAIIIGIISFIYGFAVLKLQNIDQERRLEKLEDDFSKINTAQQAIDTKLAQIQTDISWIKNALNK